MGDWPAACYHVTVRNHQPMSPNLQRAARHPEDPSSLQTSTTPRPAAPSTQESLSAELLRALNAMIWSAPARPQALFQRRL